MQFLHTLRATLAGAVLMALTGLAPAADQDGDKFFAARFEPNVAYCARNIARNLRNALLAGDGVVYRQRVGALADLLSTAASRLDAYRKNLDVCAAQVPAALASPAELTLPASGDACARNIATGLQETLLAGHDLVYRGEFLMLVGLLNAAAGRERVFRDALAACAAGEW